MAAPSSRGPVRRAGSVTVRVIESIGRALARRTTRWHGNALAWPPDAAAQRVRELRAAFHRSAENTARPAQITTNANKRSVGTGSPYTSVASTN